MHGGYEVWPSGNLQVIVLISTLVQDSNLKMKIGTCTGTLVTPSWILTAAHCFPDGTRKILLEFGGKDARGRWKCVRKARQVVFYNGKLFGRIFGLTDLAMVEVAGRCDKASQPMLMHRKDRIQDRIRNCTITGFGYTNSKEEKSGTWRAGSLHQILVRNSDISFVIPGRILVWVASSGHGPCKGDSGGPLVCNGLLYGVLSRIVHHRKTNNYSCGWPNGTAIYDNVADHMDWIEYVISNRNSENSSPKCVVSPYVVIMLCVIIVFEFY